MKVAIPLFEQEVAPRFGFADCVMLADVRDNEIVDRRYLPIRGRGILERLEEIGEQGVETLLCGGFNRNFIPFAQTLGMTVYVGLTGTGEAILAAFAAGEFRAASQWSTAGDPRGPKGCGCVRWGRRTGKRPRSA